MASHAEDEEEEQNSKSTSDTSKVEDSAVVSNIVVAIVDNNSWEVGVAELDILLPTKLSVSQVTDDRSYSTTLQRLSEIQPREILVPDSHFSRPLCDALRKHHGAKVTALNRSFFNETRGGELMNNLSLSQIQTKQHTHSHYLGRAAACALVTYAERSRGGDTIRRLIVELDPWVESSGRLRMDGSTIKALELVANHRTGGKEGTLLSVLKHTRTAMGSRLLRGQIISPPANLPVINSRLDAVEECVQLDGCDDDRQEEARSALDRMCDLDRLCSRFSTEPARFTVRELKSEIEAVLGVRAFSKELSTLLFALEPYQTTLWQAVKKGLQTGMTTFSSLDQCIETVTTQPVPSKRTDHHLQDIFCVKADVDGLLDVARLAYVQVVKDMETLVDTLRETSGLYKLELKRTTGRGYHLSIPRTFESRLPSYFLQAVRYRKNILCTTVELASLNNRQSRLESEILALTVARLRPIRASIVGSLDALLKVSELVAMADLMLGFAELSHDAGYVKPTIVDKSDAGINLRKARHPILETIIDNYEPREISLAPGQRVVIITGENCAGKTTLLTQIGVTSVMAQLGCYVPASLCETVLFSRICTRLATDDALEENASTFSLEMLETASILDAVDHCPTNTVCLVLIDELGRGTSTRDGMAIAAATAEHLITRTSARAFFSTHFARLQELVDQYPERARSFNVRSITSAPGHDGYDLENDDYGIRLAQECAMPEEVINDARVLRAKLVRHFKSREDNTDQSDLIELNPVRELFKVLQAIRHKVTDDTGNPDIQEAKRLLTELRSRVD